MGIDYSKILEQLRGAMGAFVYSLFTKWYLLVAGAALIVTYQFFKGIDSLGILTSIYNTLDSVFQTTIEKSKVCPQKIADFSAFMKCLDTP